jgi:beta-lactamase class A
VDFPAGLEEQARRLPGRLGVAVRYLPNGPEYALRSAESFYPASVIKVPILAEVFAQAAEGHLDLDARIALTNQDRREGSGVPASLSGGLALTVADLAELMIVVSDNTATAMLVRLVCAGNVNARMRTLGLVGTRVGGWWEGDDRNTEQSATTPGDMLRLFELLWRGELVSLEASTRMLDMLGRQQFMGLARYLPVDDLSEAEGRRNSRVLIASKSGEVNGVRNDVGLITARTAKGSRAYIVSIFTNEVEDDRLWTAENPALLVIGEVSRLAYRHLLEDL